MQNKEEHLDPKVEHNKGKSGFRQDSESKTNRILRK